MSKIVKQRNRRECYVAALAMALGVDAEDVPHLFTDESLQTIAKEGTSWEMRSKLLKEAGRVPNLDCWNLSVPEELQASYLIRDMLKGRRAILSVPSINNTEGAHALYWDGYHIYDPSTLQTYPDRLDGLRILQVTLFAEVAVPVAHC